MGAMEAGRVRWAGVGGPKGVAPGARLPRGRAHHLVRIARSDVKRRCLVQVGPAREPGTVRAAGKGA